MTGGWREEAITGYKSLQSIEKTTLTSGGCRLDWHSTCYFCTRSHVLTTMASHVQQVKGGHRVEYLQSRRCSRIPLQAPVFLKASDASGAEFIELTKTLNISSIGACITSTHLLKLDQTVQLTIPAPSQTSSSLIPSETPPIAARIKWQDVSGELRLFGLEFLRPLE